MSHAPVQETNLDRRVDMLYLVDSVLQASQRGARSADASASAIARVFRDTIAAALPRCRRLRVYSAKSCTTVASTPTAGVFSRFHG